MMTKEDYIKNLQSMIDDAENMGLYDEDVESLQVAIKALEQEPCEDWHDVPSNEMTLEQSRQAVRDLRKKLAPYLMQEPCDDAISRQAVLNATVKKNSVWNSITNSKGGNLEEIVLQLSSVQPKVKTGHWVVDREAFRLNIRGKQIFDYSVHCDKCNYRCDYTTDVKGSLPSNYCPNCGAKMESEDKE